MFWTPVLISLNTDRVYLIKKLVPNEHNYQKIPKQMGYGCVRSLIIYLSPSYVPFITSDKQTETPVQLNQF